MPRDADTVNVHLRFSKKEHGKLVKKKDALGLTWEEYILKVAGIVDE